MVRTGLKLAKNTDLESIVQAATDAGLQLCGAQFGAFFYNVVNAEGESYLLYTLSGAEREKFAGFPMPRNTAVFAPTFSGEGVVRSADITKDPRYGKSAPWHGMPEGHLPVRSYLAIPVVSQSGEVLGGLFYGHAEVDVFQQDAEDLVAAVAAQAAVAMENARLRETLKEKIMALEEAEKLQRAASKGVAELAAIVESSSDAILSKDLTGCIMSWNQAAERILGYTAEEMVGCSILKLIPPEFHSEETAILNKIRAGERIDHYETVRITRSGERLNVSLTISPVRDTSGRIVGASKILRDISSRKRIEQSLIDAEKIAATGRMAAAIAHEINNPLESIVNLIFLARSNAGDTARVEEYLRAADDELARVSHIARQTLGFYREHTSAATTSLPDLIRQTLKVYGPKCDAAGIRISTVFDPVPEVVVRRGELMQVISNLITNSIYAMPSGGALIISLHQSEVEGKPKIVLTIEDTGQGIPKENLERVFEPFFTTRGAVGTGIGLWIARKLVEGQGGAIALESSNNPDAHGTKVSIFLPIGTASNP